MNLTDNNRFHDGQGIEILTTTLHPMENVPICIVGVYRSPRFRNIECFLQKLAHALPRRQA